MPIKRSLSFFAILACAASCGPNVLSVKVTVTNPLIRDNEIIRAAFIVRKEPRATQTVAIAGAPRLKSRGWLVESAEIIPQATDGNSLYIDASIYGITKDEIALSRNYKYYLELPDGRRIVGEVHRLGELVNLSTKITGVGRHPTFKIRNAQGGTTQRYAFQEVEDRQEFYWRQVRVIFHERKMITMETKWIRFVMEGEGRRRVFLFNFTTKAEEIPDPKYVPFKGEDE